MSVKSRILHYINKHDFIPVDKLMTYALKADGGYYKTKKNIIGRIGDFITAPEISQLFGEIIGIWCILQYKILGSPKKINIVELGPGSGLLMRDILRTAKLNNEFYNALKINLYDINKYFKESQKGILKDFDKEIIWINSVDEVAKIPSIFIANEFFDAMPIKQYIKIKNYWFEQVCNIENAVLIYDKVEIEGKIQDELNLTYPNARSNAILERSYAAKKYIKDIAAQISANFGSALIIDYGYYINPKNRNSNQFNSTLQGLINHKYTDIFENLGFADLSAHVDFYELESTALRYKNISTSGFTTQRDFLLSHGIQTRYRALIKNLNQNEQKILNNQVERLINSNRMGNLFKVLSFFCTKH